MTDKAAEVHSELKKVSDRIEEQRAEMGTILVSHLSKKPIAVLVVSLTEQGFITHCSGFQDVGHALIARELAHKAATQQFERFMVQNRAEQNQPENVESPGPTGPMEGVQA